MKQFEKWLRQKNKNAKGIHEVIIYREILNKFREKKK
jgi:hypothetical protein